MLDTGAMKRTTPRKLACLLAVAFAAGCAQEPGEISRDTRPFDGIAPAANIEVLGTEPFWNITIEPEGEGYAATYRSPEDLEGTEFPVTRFAGNNGLSFSGELRGEAVLVALTPGECSDGMSDRSYPYVATVKQGERDLSGCASTSDEPFSGSAAP